DTQGQVLLTPSGRSAKSSIHLQPLSLEQASGINVNTQEALIPKTFTDSKPILTHYRGIHNNMQIITSIIIMHRSCHFILASVDPKVSPHRVQPSVFNHGQGRITFSPISLKLKDVQLSPQASLLKNPYEGYLKSLPSRIS
ncbi:hypothetical protein A2U01_0027699, partial [Trifolium medium]|nr:hypothetical protein [Trifolium medium]